MKSIIAGKTYNTDTATLICDISNGWKYHGNRNNHNIEEGALYVTKKGDYFLAGGGGPHSRFAKIVGTQKHWGKKIVTLSEDQALDEAQSNASFKTLREFFGEHF